MEFGLVRRGTLPSSVGVAVSGVTDAVDISVGYSTSCAVRASGQLVCWGRYVGNGVPEEDSLVPVLVEGIEDAVAVSSDGDGTCVVHATGQVSCWGWGWGPLDEADLVPSRWEGIEDAVSVSMAYTGGGSGACVRRAGGGVACWGFHHDLGGDSLESSASPVDVLDLDDAVGLDDGPRACAVRATGGVDCWGDGARRREQPRDDVPSDGPEPRRRRRRRRQPVHLVRRPRDGQGVVLGI